MSGMKGIILSYKKQLDDIRKHDVQLKNYVKEYEDQKVEIQNTLRELGTLDELFSDIQERTEMFNMINESMERLNKDHKDTKQKMIDYVATKNEKLGTFAATMPTLFEKILFGDMDMTVLNHCLDTYTLYEENRISLEEAKERGYHKYHQTQQ